MQNEDNIKLVSEIKDYMKTLEFIESQPTFASSLIKIDDFTKIFSFFINFVNLNAKTSKVQFENMEQIR